MTSAATHPLFGQQIRPRPAEAREVDALIVELGRRAAGGSAVARSMLAMLRQDPRVRPEQVRVVQHDGGILGLILLAERLVRTGSVGLRGALIFPPLLLREAPVAGVEQALLRDGLEWLRLQGCHLAMLWRSPMLHPGLGFAPALKHYEVVLPTGLAVTAEEGYSARPASASDAAAMASCYHRATAVTALAEVRSDEPWQWRVSGAGQMVEVIADRLGSVRGYFRAAWSDGELRVHEVAVADYDVAPALTHRLLHHADGATVRVTATPDNEWSRWAIDAGATSMVAGRPHGAMIRVLDLSRWLDALRPELERRIARSEWRCGQGRLRLETPLGSRGIRVDNGRVAFDDGRDAPLVTLPWGAFGALAVGYRSVEAVGHLPGVRIEGEQTRRLLDRLFPEGYPHWSAPGYLM